ncbi:MAG: hypothetical protein P8I93_10045 [Crocinitomicaceae bacterium]|nr:hypothetical protein [Crocinitomicaceae bacterium]
MKNLLLTLFMGLSIIGFAQSNDTTKNIKIKNDDLELQKLKAFGDAYAKEMSTWTKEYKKWFVENFFYKRGEIKIPKEPISAPPPKYKN